MCSSSVCLSRRVLILSRRTPFEASGTRLLVLGHLSLQKQYNILHIYTVYWYAVYWYAVCWYAAYWYAVYWYAVYCILVCCILVCCILYVYIYIYWFIYLYLYLSIHPSIHPCIHASIHSLLCLWSICKSATLLTFLCFGQKDDAARRRWSSSNAMLLKPLG